MFPRKRKNVRLPRRPQGAATTQPCFCCLVSEKRQRLLYVTRNTSSCWAGWGKERKIALHGPRGFRSLHKIPSVFFKGLLKRALFKGVLGTRTIQAKQEKDFTKFAIVCCTQIWDLKLEWVAFVTVFLNFIRSCLTGISVVGNSFANTRWTWSFTGLSDQCQHSLVWPLPEHCNGSEQYLAA